LTRLPVSFWKEGCADVWNETERFSEVHRTNLIFAFTVNGKEISAAGQNAILRRLIIGGQMPITPEKLFGTIRLSVAVLTRGKMVIGTGERIVNLPKDRVLFKNGEIGGF
jgi:hypothetical protein